MLRKLLVRFGAFAALLLSASHVRAQARLVDLELTGSISPGTLLLPGTAGRLTFTFRNLGPDQALGAGYLSNDYVFTGPGAQIVLFPVADTAPCTFIFDDFPPPPGQPGFAIVTLYIGSMAPNQSVTCQVGIQSVPAAIGAFALQFEAREVSGNASDPNPTNNVVRFPLQFEVPTVPNLSTSSLVVLGSLLLLACLFRIPETGSG